MIQEIRIEIMPIQKYFWSCRSHR